MKDLLTYLLPSLFVLILCNSPTFAIETAPHISDREIVERLTRLEEGQAALRGEMKQFREDMNKQFERIDAQFNRVDTQFGRVDAQFNMMDKQFDRLVNIMLAIIGVFASMCGGTIWFALWDRRSMIRPFESKVKKIEEDIADNRNKLHSLIDTFKTLSKTDEKVATILKKFNLL
ncbi:MAG: hypothetical protein HW390_1031 [Candidatus Brocadiaceae bacterium]|nr:hypothetical protein [Candidatus Brocadiaceae bacterium]